MYDRNLFIVLRIQKIQMILGGIFVDEEHLDSYEDDEDLDDLSNDDFLDDYEDDDFTDGEEDSEDLEN